MVEKKHENEGQIRLKFRYSALWVAVAPAFLVVLRRVSRVSALKKTNHTIVPALLGIDPKIDNIKKPAGRSHTIFLSLYPLILPPYTLSI